MIGRAAVASALALVLVASAVAAGASPAVAVDDRTPVDVRSGTPDDQRNGATTAGTDEPNGTTGTDEPNGTTGTDEPNTTAIDDDGRTGSGTDTAVDGTGAATGIRAEGRDAGSDWPTFGADPANTGFRANATGPTAEVYERWRVQTGDYVTSTPVVVDGTVYVGSWNDTLTAIDADTGERRWRFATDYDVERSPAVANGTVYAATTNATVHAVDADTGTETWRRQLDVAADGLTVANGTVYVDSGDLLFGLDARTAEVEFFRYAGDEVVPAVVNGTVYYASDGNVAAGVAGTEGGSDRWSFATGGEVLGSPTVADGTVYATSADNYTYALDADTGEQRWRTRTGAVYGSPAIADGVVYVGSVDDHVYALDADTGREQWRFRTGGPVVASPSVAGDTVYVPSVDNDTYALGADTGERRWRYRTDRYSTAGAAVADGTVYVGTFGGAVYALDGEHRPSNGSIEASLEREPLSPTAGDPVTFAVRNVTTGTAVETVRWRFGDGATATGRRVVHSYADNRTYDVAVSIETTTGATRTIGTRVTVGRPATDAVAIRNVTASPAGELPAGLPVDRTLAVDAVGPGGVEEVRFVVDGDRYVDADGSDGWTAAIPVASHGPNATVRIVAAGAGGGTANATVPLGVRPVGPFLATVVERGRTNASGDAVSAGLAIPDGETAEFDVGVPVIGGVEGEMRGRVVAVVYPATGAADLKGSLKGDAAVPPVKAKGEGALAARVAPSTTGYRFDSIRGKLAVAGGGYREVPLEVLGYGVTVDAFVGPFVEAKPTWRDPSRFPRPTNATVYFGAELTGTTTAEFTVVDVEGELSSKGGFETTYPDLGENASFKGQIVFKGTVQWPYTERQVKEILYGTEVGISGTEAGIDGEDGWGLRTKRGGVPAVGIGAASVGEAGIDRLTSDGLADESPDVAATAGGYLLAWDRQGANRTVREGRDVFVRTADAGGNWSTRTRVTDDRTMDLDPSVAANGSGGQLLAWTRLNRSFANESTIDRSDVFAATSVAVAARDADGTWAAPRLLPAEGSAFSPRVARGDGRYLLAWHADRDGDRNTTADRGVRYATYDAATDSLGTVRALPNATTHRVAGDAHGLRLAAFRPDGPGKENGTVVVRNVTAGTAREYRTTGVDDIAASSDAVAWVNGSTPTATVNYVADDGAVATAGTAGVAAVDDLDLLARETAAGERVAVLTFAGRTATGGVPTGDVDVFSRAYRDGTWTAPRRLTPGTTPLTYAQVATAGRGDGLVSAFVGRNRSTADQHHDLFAVHHAYAPDLNVSATASPVPVAPNGSLTVTYAVRNDGAATARDVRLAIADATETVATPSPAGHAALAPGERVTGSVTVRANRSRTVTVRVWNGSAGPDATPSDEATATVMRPNLAIGSVERRPTAGAVDYDVTVTNRGPVAVANATVGATNGGRLVVERDLGRLAPNESTTATLRLADGAVDARLPTRLRTDPGDGLDESDESDGRRVVRPPLPDLFVPATGVTPAEEGTCDATSVDGRAICVLVGNRGSAAANATVTVTAGNASASRPVALPGTGPNGTAFRSVAVAVDALSLSAGDRATVRIRAAAPDARPVDDAVGVRITPALAGHPFASPLVAGGNRPRDPDGDGRYEDVDGDGTVGFLDVIDLLFVDWASLDEAGQRAAMDFDANGRVGFLDVVTLLFEL